MIKILIIEDDLRAEGYDVEFAVTGTSGLEMAFRPGYDLILLDLMLPGIGGLDICKELRRRNIGTPVIMLTARSQDIDKVVGLELGADDYITKPFHSLELRARIKAVLRRTRLADPRAYSQLIRVGPYEMETGMYRLRKDGVEIELTAIEFDILRLLMCHPGEVIHRDRIMNEVWGTDVWVTGRNVDAHIAKLRRKIGDSEQEWIKCLRGVGYKFAAS